MRPGPGPGPVEPGPGPVEPGLRRRGGQRVQPVKLAAEVEVGGAGESLHSPPPVSRAAGPAATVVPAPPHPVPAVQPTVFSLLALATPGQQAVLPAGVAAVVPGQEGPELPAQLQATVQVTPHVRQRRPHFLPGEEKALRGRSTTSPFKLHFASITAFVLSTKT